MFFCVTTKKAISKAFVISVCIGLFVCAFLWRFSNVSKASTLPQNAVGYTERVDFLGSLGFTVDTSVNEQSKEIQIPYIFSDIYEEYNKLQTAVGYDLYRYSGKTVTLYTLKLDYQKRDDVYANLLVFDGSVIGGDVSALSVDDGFMLPLAISNN